MRSPGNSAWWRSNAGTRRSRSCWNTEYPFKECYRIGHQIPSACHRPLIFTRRPASHSPSLRSSAPLFHVWSKRSCRSKPRQLFLSEVLVCPGSNKTAVKCLLPRLYAPKPSQITRTCRRCRQRALQNVRGMTVNRVFVLSFSGPGCIADTSVGCFNLRRVDEAANPN